MTLVRAAVQSGVKVSWDDTIHFSTQLAEDDDAEEGCDGIVDEPTCHRCC